MFRLMPLNTLTRLATASVLALVCAGPLHAGLLDDDEARRAILDLRQRLENNQKNQANAVATLAEENSQLRRALLDLQGQIDGLKAEINKSRGQNEQLARDLSELQLRHKDALAGLDARFRKLEPIKVTLDGREFSAEMSEKRDYEQALDIFRKSDFVAARTSWLFFVQRYPQSGYLPSALFWLGNAEYVTKDYKESQSRFRQMLSLAPEHPRAAEAMLAISNVQQELKDPKAARKTLEDLIKAYPDSETGQTAKDRLARLR